MLRTPLLMVLVMLAGLTRAVAEVPPVETIIERANQAAYYPGSDGRAEVRMTIADGRGGTRIREFVILRLNQDNLDQKFYVYFTAPADVREMAYLVWKHVDRDDDRWLWLPALNLSRRIAPGDKRTSFVGSDFVYEDVSGRGTQDDTHELIETTDTEFVIRSTPKDARSVEFAHYQVWIDRETYLPRKAEYVDANGELFRRVLAVDIDPDVQGYPTVITSVVENLRTGGATTNTFRNVRYDIGLSERIFTERFLRRPPREVR